MVASSKLQMIAPIAPASWALKTFRLKSQIPRSINAIFPARLGALVSGPQASGGPAWATSPWMGPDCARGTVNAPSTDEYSPMAAAGLRTLTALPLRPASIELATAMQVRATAGAPST
jgi:hypothetical protein